MRLTNMRRLLLATLLFLPCALGQKAYSPPQVTSAGDAYTPYTVVFDGLFVLDVSIGDDGSISKIEALRNPGAMLDAIETAVRTWKFQPALIGRKTQASRMTVAFVYRPGNLQTFGAAPTEGFKPVMPPSRADDGTGDYVPPGITSFAYPEYPVNSVASGSVVLQATVDDSGNVKNVAVLHAMAGFNRFAQGALKNWRFQAATVRGRSVTSNIVVAFIFQPPPSPD
jgi:TonB family protein